MEKSASWRRTARLLSPAARRPQRQRQLQPQRQPSSSSAVRNEQKWQRDRDLLHDAPARLHCEQGAANRENNSVRSSCWLVVPLAFVGFQSSAVADESLLLPNGRLGLPICARIMLRNQQCEASPSPNTWLCDPYPRRVVPRAQWFESSLEAATKACFVWDDLERGHYFCESIDWIRRVASLSWIAHVPYVPTTFPDCFRFEREDMTYSRDNPF